MPTICDVGVRCGELSREKVKGTQIFSQRTLVLPKTLKCFRELIWEGRVGRREKHQREWGRRVVEVGGEGPRKRRKNGGRMRDQRGARGWKPFLQMSSTAFKSLWACRQRSDCHGMLWRATLMKVPGRERKLWSAEHCPVFRRKKCTMKVQWQCSPLPFLQVLLLFLWTDFTKWN